MRKLEEGMKKEEVLSYIERNSNLSDLTQQAFSRVIYAFWEANDQIEEIK